MKDKSTARVIIANELVLIGIGLGALFWILESALETFVFHEGNLIERLFTPGLHEIWMRLLVLSIFVAFGIYAQSTIAKRKRAEEKLMDSEKRYRTLVETSSECICNLDLEGNFLYMSPAGLKFHEMSEDEVKGMHCTKLAKPEYSAPLNETLAKAKKGETAVFQYESETPSGDRWFESTLTPIKDDSGEVISMLRLSSDITERKRAEEALQESGEKERTAILNILEDLKGSYRRLERAYEELKDVDRLKTDIISNVSHELRTPITITKASIELAREETSKEDQKELLSTAEKALVRLNDIVENLISAADMHAGAHRLHLQDVELKGMVPEFIKGLKRLALERKVAIKARIKKDLPKVRVDPKALERVFENLLSNAIKFSNEEGGKVIVKAKKEDSTLRVSISDTGIGIPKDKLDAIFAPLYQLDASARRIYGGMGMGLAVARSIVTAHGGRMWAESTVGEGTTVHFTLPIALEK